MGRLNYQVGDRINPFYAVPVGTILPFAGSSIPAGWLECAGQVLSRATYPDLFAAIGTTYGAATSETFNLPDLRGEFLRGWDNGKGVDPGRALGSAQADALQNINGTASTILGGSGAGSFSGSSGAFNLDTVTSDPVLNSVGSSSRYSRLLFDASRVARTASETRPRNVAVRFCIRAFGSIENSGLIDVGALAVEVSDAVKIGDFIGGNQSKSASGYQKLPGGLIVQWGTTAIASQNGIVTLPIAFPNSYLSGSVVKSTDNAGAAVYMTLLFTSNSTIKLSCWTNAGDISRIMNTVHWIAIGH